MPKRWLFLVFGAGAPVCISLASIVPILVCILPLVSGTVGIRSSCSGTAYRSGSDNRKPLLFPFLCHIRTSKFVSQAFRFQCFIYTFG